MSSRVVVNFTLAIAIIGGAFALWESSNLQTESRPEAFAMRMDRCPYYPSPAVCGTTAERAAAEVRLLAGSERPAAVSRRQRDVGFGLNNATVSEKRFRACAARSPSRLRTMVPEVGNRIHTFRWRSL